MSDESREQRIAKALDGVNLSAPDLSIDQLYAEKFPTEVDLHTFRAAALRRIRDMAVSQSTEATQPTNQKGE